MQTNIPYNLPSIGEEEIQEVANTLRSGWLTSGQKTMQFEKEFREYVRAPYSLALNSCTAGLHLALLALEIGPGDEVITTPMTFCATVNTIIHVGATPVLADLLPDGNIDPSSIRERITPRTKAIIPVHLAGLPCAMDEIWAIVREHGLKVIEDAAHAVGTLYKGYQIGEGNPAKGYYSDAVAYSFYATKNLTTGEGGMVTTHDKALEERMRILCLHGISRDAWNRYSAKGKWQYDVVESGYKYNLSDIQSSLGIHQLRKQEAFIERRRQIAELYNKSFAHMPELELPADDGEHRHCWHLYILRLNLDQTGLTRNELIDRLKERGVGTSVHFIPVPLHSFFAEYAKRAENSCPKALALFERIISLPLYPDLSDEQVLYVARAVQEVVEESRYAQSLPSAAVAST